VVEYNAQTLQRIPVNHDAKRRQQELDAALERINAQSVQTGTPTPAPAPPVDNSAPVVDPTTALAPTIIDLPDPPKPAPAASAPAPAPAPPAPAVPTPEDWAKLEKRRKDAEAALTPWMQRSAALQNEVKAAKEERESTQARLASLETNIANLVQTLQTQMAPKAPLYNPETDPELDALDPIIAVRLRKMNSTFDQRLADQERKYREDIQAIKDQDKRRAQELVASQTASYEQTWDETFTKLVPDYTRFMGDKPEAFALSDWARTMPLEYGIAIANPKKHSPHFVAKVVNEFKASLTPEPTPARQPSLGDLANAQLGGAVPPRVTLPEVVNPLTDYEIRNAQSILDKLYRSATDTKNKAVREAKLKEAEDFMERYKRQLQSA
jgi:hypothetical protein